MTSNARELAQIPSIPSGRRNLIINGAMNVAQRGTSVTGISTSGYKALDRMRHSLTSFSTARFTQEQVSDAPDGFSNSLKLTTTTAEGGIPANGRLSVIDYRIEAQDLQHLKYGTSDAKKITLSFWVKSSLTGLTTVGIYAPDGVRSIGRSYTINSANTWEYKTLTFDGDTNGTINNDNGVGLEILFQVAAGSDYTSTPIQTSWGASSNFNYEFNGGNTLNLIDTLNATFQITGIQLEVGSVATEFEHRSYGEELQLCKRYLQKIRLDQYNSPMILRGTNGNVASSIVNMLPVTMRDNFTSDYTGNVTAAYWSNIGNTGYSTETVQFYITSRSGGRGYAWAMSQASFVGNNELVATANYSSSQWLYLDAEL